MIFWVKNYCHKNYKTEKIIKRSEKKFPDCHKVAIVLPVHESGTKNNPDNYRPMSLLPVNRKNFEKLIHKRTIDFLDKHGVVTKKQFGFRPKISTIDALINFMEGIRND